MSLLSCCHVVVFCTCDLLHIFNPRKKDPSSVVLLKLLIIPFSGFYENPCETNCNWWFWFIHVYQTFKLQLAPPKNGKHFTILLTNSWLRWRKTTPINNTKYLHYFRLLLIFVHGCVVLFPVQMFGVVMDIKFKFLWQHGAVTYTWL